MQSKIVLSTIVSLFIGLSSYGQTTDDNVMIREDNAPIQSKYKRNILALAPIQFSENGVAGVGISYEHGLDKNSIVSFYVPVMAVLNTNNNNNYNDYYGNRTTNTDPMFYVMPGIKIYPTGG